jgi:hypothetical protein
MRKRTLTSVKKDPIFFAHDALILKIKLKNIEILYSKSTN